MNAFVLILLTLGAASAMPLGYQKGKRYTYNYQCNMTHAVRSGSAKTLGLRVKCQVHLDVLKKTEIQFTLENIQVLQVTGSLEDPKQQQEKAADAKVVAAMQQRLELPVRVALKAQDNCIKQVNAHPQDEEWSLNIKRGLVNLFQIAPREADQEFVTQHETTAVGDCQVSYAIVRDNSQSDQKDSQQFTKVTKVINYEKCQNRPEFSQYTFNAEKCEKCHQSMGYAPYHRSVGQIEHTLTGSAQAGYMIQRTEAVEEHVITPFSRSDGQVTATARQCLEYQKSCAAGQALTTLTKETSHRFVAENPEKRARENAQWQQEVAKQAEATVDDMCAAVQQRLGQQAAEKFTNLVQQLRQCNKDTLEKLADKMLARQDQSERKFCCDALSYAGTAEAAQVLWKKFQEKKLNKPDELKRVFLGLASASRPTADHINIAWDLCNHAEVAKDTSCRRQCMLTFGALVHKIYQRPSLQQDTKAMAACQQHVKEIQARLANKQTTADEKLMYIKAIGNAGSSEAIEELHKILRDREQPLRIRVECAWALRRILPAAREKATPRLISVFADANECPELRMAIFSLLLNSELNFATLQTVANIVKREITNPIQGPRSNQVASYVVSHLWALAYHNNVLTKKRSMQARLVLRLMPRMNYGLSYSKGMRFAYHSEKFQAGFELEANKMDVPDSMLPRNMNARIQLNLMGYKMNAFEFGARIENMDQVIEQVMSEVRNRHKRSLFGNVLSWLNKEASDDKEGDDKKPTSRPTQRVSSTSSSRPTARSSSRPTSSSPMESQRPSTRQQLPSSLESDGQSKPQHLSAFMKLFGDEVKYMEITQENIKQFTQDFADLLLGKKDQIEYADQGIVISKKGMKITQRLEKAFQLANARCMVPTLAGFPLDFQYRSAAVVKLTAAANMNVEPSIASLLHFQKLTCDAEITPSFGAHEHAQIGIHTPYLRMGLQMKTAAQANPDQKIDVTFEAAKEYSINYNLPKEQCDIVHIKYDTQAFVEEKNPENCTITQQQICMDFKTPHLKKIEKTCKGQDLFGVQFCVEGQVPDLPALRLEQVPAFPTIALTELRVTMAPAADKPTAVHWTHQVAKNDEKEIQVLGQIDASSETVPRQMPYKITYTKANQQLLIEAHGTKAPGCEDCMLTCTVNYQGMKLQFGRGQLQYQVCASWQVQDQGKTLRLQFDWTEVPEQWRRFFYDWEPQIWYFIQHFAWVRRSEQYNKQVAIEFSLFSPMTAQLRVKMPDAMAERTDLALPLTIERFPSSLQEIKNYFYAQCEVQDQSVKVFDNLQYKHNIHGGGCPYVLVQDHRKGKQSRIQLTVMIDKQGQKTVAAKIQQPSQESVVIKPDQTILIDGQQADCSQKACESKQGGATVAKVEKSDGKTQIQLSTKLGLHATIEDQRIQVFASPLLRSRVRGLCGDADGEQWNEYKDPQDQVQELGKFIQSWQQDC